MTPRSLAYELLIKAEKSKQYSNITLDNALQNNDMSVADKRLASVLFYGVTEKRITLDYRISQISNRPLAELDVTVRTALRLGLYQLMYLDRIPPHAAINESVSLCSKRASGFVNAILREHTRRDCMSLPSKNNMAEYLSVAYSVCLPLAEKFISVFGAEKAEQILSGFDRTTDTTIRVNTLKTTREALAKTLEYAKNTENSPVGLHVRGSIRELFGYDEGLFFVQDEASQICVEALGAKVGDTVLDICSCPGSKSFGAAINMNNSGKILSFDLHESKLSLIHSSAKRLGITIIEANAHDGRDFISDLEYTADKVLCDVPCSGFGVLSKKPELRYKDPSLSATLPQIQLDILENACRYVKPNGVLIYSTCTIFPEENELNIERFLSKHNDFEAFPWSVGDIHASNGTFTLYPHIHNTDGFFIAKLKRKKL